MFNRQVPFSYILYNIYNTILDSYICLILFKNSIKVIQFITLIYYLILYLILRTVLKNES